MFNIYIKRQCVESELYLFFVERMWYLVRYGSWDLAFVFEWFMFDWFYFISFEKMRIFTNRFLELRNFETNSIIRWIFAMNASWNENGRERVSEWEITCITGFRNFLKIKCRLSVDDHIRMRFLANWNEFVLERVLFGEENGITLSVTSTGSNIAITQHQNRKCMINVPSTHPKNIRLILKFE